MTTIKKDIHMTRGDTLSFGLEIDGLNQDLETAYFSIKQKFNEDIVIIQKSLGDGITKVDDGKYTIRVAPEDTQYVALGEYLYDLEIGVNGDIFTPIKGILFVGWEVTRHVD